jgi:hypothetical protein
VLWTASVQGSSAGLALVDVAVGPTGDVVLADVRAGTTFEQHRWTSTGAFQSTHQDASGAFNGAMFTSGLFIDASNDAFYGELLTGSQGADTAVRLTWSLVDPRGTLVFTQSTDGSMPASSAAPAVRFLQVGGDATSNLHGAFEMGSPEYVPGGVYCFTYGGSYLGAGAANVTSVLIGPSDFVWPSLDNALILFKPLTAPTDLGCGSLAVPAEGAVALAKLSGAGSCNWSKLLALPTRAVDDASFRISRDGSMLAAVAHSGTIDLGSGPISPSGGQLLSLARFDQQGDLVWAKSFGGAGSSFHVGSLGGNAAGEIVLTSGYSGAVDLGGGALPSTDDTLVALFDANGRPKWSTTVKVGAQGALIAAPAAHGVAVATDSPEVDFGTGPLAMAAGGVASIGVAALVAHP